MFTQRKLLPALRPALLLAFAVLTLCALSWALLGGLASTPEEGGNAAWHSFGGQGEEPGHFQQPRGITGLPDGSFVVVDRAARVQQISSDGKPLKLWSMKDHDCGNPKGLAALPNGNLLICDTHYGRVLEMTVDGQRVKTWGEYGTGPSQFIHPLSAAVDAARGAVYVVEYHGGNDRVQKFTLDGKFVKTWGTFGDQPGQFSRPSGVCVDKDGNVYVADGCNHRIQKFDPDGKLLKCFGGMGREPGELRYPYDIACGPDGLLYVAEFNNHRVSVFDREGGFVRILGGPGGGEEEFDCLWSLAVDARGRLLVSDSRNHRIHVIDLERQRDLAVAHAIQK